MGKFGEFILRKRGTFVRGILKQCPYLVIFHTPKQKRLDFFLNVVDSMAIENLKKNLILALLICNTSFWLYIKPKTSCHIVK
jgi:hypothetical protein